MINNLLNKSNMPETTHASPRGRPAINYDDFDALCESEFDVAELSTERFCDIKHARNAVSSSLHKYNKSNKLPYRLRLKTADNKLYVYKDKGGNKNGD